jgi:hypothetical protein
MGSSKYGLIKRTQNLRANISFLKNFLVFVHVTKGMLNSNVVGCPSFHLKLWITLSFFKAYFFSFDQFYNKMR